jgi:hypothetical protein
MHPSGASGSLFSFDDGPREALNPQLPQALGSQLGQVLVGE